MLARHRNIKLKAASAEGDPLMKRWNTNDLPMTLIRWTSCELENTELSKTTGEKNRTCGNCQENFTGPVISLELEVRAVCETLSSMIKGSIHQRSAGTVRPSFELKKKQHGGPKKRTSQQR